MNEIKVNTVIIGAGISGLSAAHFLSKKSNDFLILESQNQVGGIIQTVIKNDFICENGPNTVLLNNDLNIFYLISKVVLTKKKNKVLCIFLEK